MIFYLCKMSVKYQLETVLYDALPCKAGLCTNCPRLGFVALLLHLACSLYGVDPELHTDCYTKSPTDQGKASKNKVEEVNDDELEVLDVKTSKAKSPGQVQYHATQQADVKELTVKPCPSRFPAWPPPNYSTHRPGSRRRLRTARTPLLPGNFKRKKLDSVAL